MQGLNRQQRRQLDKTVDRSIKNIKAELAFLNAAGNPKYKLVVQSNLEYKAKSLLSKMAFWR